MPCEVTPGAAVPVTGINVFAIGPQPSDVALGILNGTAAGPGGFREGIAFRSNPGGTAVSDVLVRRGINAVEQPNEAGQFEAYRRVERTRLCMSNDDAVTA